MQDVVLLVLLTVKSQTIMVFQYKYTLKGRLACQKNAHKNSLQVNNSIHSIDSIHMSSVTTLSWTESLWSWGGGGGGGGGWLVERGARNW